MEIRKAQRQQAKLRIGMSGISGSGKSRSALELARGLVSSWDKIGVIDTENKSAHLYSDLGDYNVLSLEPPFTPERYVEAIHDFEEYGVEVIIIDSTTHEWDGDGGYIEMSDTLGQRKYKGNIWAAKSETKPRHSKFISAMIQSKCHIIATTRSKADTIQIDGKVKKIGMKDIQMDGFEHEFTVFFNIERESHYAFASKDRTGLFIIGTQEREPFIITQETGKELLEWNMSGAEVKLPPTDTELFEKFDTLLKECTTLEELKNCFFEIVKQKNTLGENFYKSLASLKDDMKASIESKKEEPPKEETAVGKLGKKAKEENEAILGSEEFKEVFGEADKAEAEGTPLEILS